MKQSKRHSRTEWEQIVAEHEQGQLSAKTFCKSRGISVASLYKWKQRLRKKHCNEDKNLPANMFLDIGQIAMQNTRPTANKKLWVVKLDLSDGITLTFQQQK